MTNGDEAGAAGMDVVAGTADRRLGYDEINKTRDYVAQHAAALTTAVGRKVEKPVDGALMARIEPGSTHSIGFYTNPDSTLFFRPVPGAGEFDRRVAMHAELDTTGHVAKTGDTMTGNLDVPNIGVSGAIYNGGMSSVVSGYVAVYRDASGRLGISPSTRRAKKNITAWAPNLQALLAIEVVTFHYRAALFDVSDPHRSAPPLEVGLIAEDLAALGLDWLVYFDAEGLPAGVHYERLALALIPIVQDHEARLIALES